jgi:hypothetical protein
MKQPKQELFTQETNEKIANNSVRENFQEESENEESDNEEEESAQEAFEEESVKDSESEVESEQKPSKPVRATAPVAAKAVNGGKARDFKMAPPEVPEISAELVNQLVSETEKTKAPVKSTLLGSGASIHNFEPNDDNRSSGASLDNAFERPVPDNTETDVVNLYKNNVTNYNVKDYLPKELNDDWFNTDFSQAKYKMNDDKLINTDKYIIGINTVGQSLKNASYDIRGAVNVPKYTVSPWNNSTIEPDYNLKPLC